jgi:hypothetical protein
MAPPGKAQDARYEDSRPALSLPTVRHIVARALF